MTDTATTGTTVTDADREAAVEALMGDGIVARKGAFSREFVQRMREDVDAAFEEARSRENGAVGRGPNRWYVEIHPQALRGFADLVDHPWVRAVSEAVLGPDYRIVEVDDAERAAHTPKVVHVDAGNRMVALGADLSEPVPVPA